MWVRKTAKERNTRRRFQITLAMSVAIVALTVARGFSVSFNRLELAWAAAVLVAWLSWRVFRISAFGVVVGLLGVNIVIFWTAFLAGVRCETTLRLSSPLLFVGLICMGVSGTSFLAIGLPDRPARRIATALSAIVVVPAIFFLVAFPCATRQRRALHNEQMNARIPLLMDFVANVEAAHDRLGHLPAKKSEFSLTRRDDRGDPGLLGCCWGVDYSKTEKNRYQLRYWALDVDYLYDSGAPDRGWYPNDTAADKRDQ